MLITCPECGKQISDKAVACPGCGYPVAEMMKKYQMFVFDPDTMTGETPEDDAAISVATEFYGELLASGDGRVWNDGGQVVARFKYR